MKIEFEAGIDECDGFPCIWIPDEVPITWINEDHTPGQLKVYGDQYHITIEKEDRNETG